MRIIGLDPSSSYCGAALVVAGQLIEANHWEKNKKLSAIGNLHDAYAWTRQACLDFNADMAVVEYLSMTRNAKTTRVVSHFQAAQALAAKHEGLVVIEARVSSARSVVLGNGGLSKDDAWDIMRKRYPNMFARKTTGGLDEMDASVLALAGEVLAER